LSPARVANHYTGFGSSKYFDLSGFNLIIDHLSPARDGEQHNMFAPGKLLEKFCTAKSNEEEVIIQGTAIPRRINVCCMLSGLCDQLFIRVQIKQKRITLTFLTG